MVARLCASLLHKARKTLGYMYNTGISDAPGHSFEFRHTAGLLDGRIRAIPQPVIPIITIVSPLTDTPYNLSNYLIPRGLERPYALSKSRCVKFQDKVTPVN